MRQGKSWPSWPQWDENERTAVDAVLRSGRWSSLQGTETQALADEFAGFQGCAHSLPLTNGTHAIEAALIALGVGEGDEVVVPAITFAATATAVLAVGATPVIVDVEPSSLCLDPAAAAAAIGPRTRAIAPVHIAGRACDMDALTELCQRHELGLVEDCAHAPGTRWRGRGVGSFGGVGTFSFESSKLITAGEGGAVATESAELASRLWSFVNCGRTEDGGIYHHESLGSNLRMTEWQSAVLRAQLRRYPAQQRRRAEGAARLDGLLATVAGVTPQTTDSRNDARAYYAYVFDYDPECFEGLPSAVFADALRAEGIVVGNTYPRLSSLALFRECNFAPRLRGAAPDIDYAALDLPGAERVERRSVWLHHPALLAEGIEIDDIAAAIARIQAHASPLRRWSSGPRALANRAANRLRARIRA